MARTKGAKNVSATAVHMPSRCHICGSTERGPYSNRTEQECITTIGDGIPVTHIIQQLTHCKNCGAARYDRSFENRPDGRRTDEPAQAVGASAPAVKPQTKRRRRSGR